VLGGSMTELPMINTCEVFTGLRIQIILTNKHCSLITKTHL